MTNTNVFHEELLGYISAVDDAVMESEMSVTLSLMEAADKAMMIMENYEGDFIDSFSIFQEAAGSGKDPAHPFKEDTVLKTIVMAPLNLIKLIIAKLNKFFNKDERTKFEKTRDALKKGLADVAEVANAIVDLAVENKESVVIAGVTITAGTALIATGALKKAYNTASTAISDYLGTIKDPKLKALKKNPAPKLVHGGAAIETHLVIDDGLPKWAERLADAMKGYVEAAEKNDVDSKTSYLTGLEALMKEFESKNAFLTEEKHIIKRGEWENVYDMISKSLGEFLTSTKSMGTEINKAQAKAKNDVQHSDKEKNNDALLNAVIKKLQPRILALASVVKSHQGEFEALKEDLDDTAKKNGFSGFIDAGKALLAKIAEKAKGVLPGNKDKSKSSDTTSSAIPKGQEAEAKQKAANTSSDSDNVTDESATITIVDEDYVQEGVTRTGKIAKVEKSAKTAGDVEKLIKKYISNVDKKGFSNEKKMLLIIGDSKIKYDNSKIEKPGEDETWDDVDMSAHDHVDRVKLYISGPGALAYAKDNGIGKAKEIQESVLPQEDETTEDVVTTESAYTSWYN